MSEPDFETLVQDFVSGSTAKQHAAFRELLAKRRHHDAVAHEGFQRGWSTLVRVAGAAESPKDRLLAVATLGRITSVAKKLRGRFRQEIAGALEKRLPDPDLLDSPDDRVYVAEVCETVHREWVPEYCARAAVIEEAGEEARLAFLRGLLRSSPEIGSALVLLASHLRAWAPTTESPGDSAGKRLRRLLAALRKAMGDPSLDPGSAPGRALQNVVSGAISGTRGPTDPKVAAETAEEVAGCVHELVRLRFSLATEAGTYDVLRTARSWLSGRRWASLAEESKSLGLLARDITEALLVLARQGICDSALADQLAVVVGSTERARDRMLTLAKKPGLPDDVRSWLMMGTKTVAVKTDLGESARAEESLLLADLMVDASRLRDSEAAFRREHMPELQVLLPGGARRLERLLNSGLGICDTIDTIARRRHLRLRGQPGDEEDFAPVDHELVEGRVGARRVRVVRPVVEQVREDGTPFVVRKGVVEPLD